jgi:Fe-S cluster assembly protein SufD
MAVENTTVQELHETEAAGTPGLTGPGTDQHGFVAHSHGGRPDTDGVPVQSRAERKASFDVADFEVPTGREEDWRFTPLDRLHELHSGVAPSGPAPDVEVDVPDGFTAETAGRGDERLGRTGAPEDRIAAQTWASAEAATVVTLGRSMIPERPAVVRVTGQGGTHYLQLLLRAVTQSSGVVVLDHRGSGTLAANVEIDVEDAAQLTVVSVQDWADDAVHVTAHSARLGRDAKLKHVVVTLGGDLVRITNSSRFTGTGGEIEALGLYFADTGQHQEHRLFVDHAVPNCRSNVTYKGALQGDGAHTVWVGDVLIRAAAEGTDTYELNRNLVLTEGARADSVPNLEIETGEIVGAGHASATGRFDDEQLFYLQARGIPEIEARRLVVRGFFAELVQRIGVPAVEERLMTSIEAELASSVGTPSLDAAAENEVTA